MKANYEGGNIYNKYESKNPFVKALMKLTFLLVPLWGAPLKVDTKLRNKKK